jgi:hypothetical protein
LSEYEGVLSPLFVVGHKEGARDWVLFENIVSQKMFGCVDINFLMLKINRNILEYSVCAAQWTVFVCTM